MSTPSAGRGSYAAASLAYLVAFALTALSASINWQFGQLLGTGDVDRTILGSVGVAAVCLAALNPFIVRAAWTQWRPVIGLICLIGVVLCSAYSMLAAYGYGASQRAPAASSSLSRADALARLQALPPARPVETLEPLVRAERNQTKRAQLQSELGTARVAMELRKQLARTDGAVQQSAEPQVLGLAALVGSTPEYVRIGLQVLLALVLELGVVTGLYGASLLWPKSHTDVLQAQPSTSVQPVAAPSVPVRAPAPEPPPARSRPPRQRASNANAVGTWLDGYMQRTNGAIRQSEAYETYRTEMRRKRRKAVPQLTFVRALRARTRPAHTAVA
jgi:hypothetical protein